jgi:hypothetical protein
VRKALNPALFGALLLLICWSISGVSPLDRRAAARETSDQERVAKNKQTILARLKRDPVEYRGDAPGLRVKSEWVDKIIRDYVHQKLVLAGELSIGERYQLSSRWIFKDMKVTFQEVFNLGPEDDEKLLPLSYGDELLNIMPGYALEGITILGKGGEVKGPYKRSVAIAGPSLALANRENPRLLSGSAVIFPLYVNREGKEKIALGLARDAYTVKWKEIKNRVIDDMSEQVYVEKLKVLRDYVSEEEFKDLH